MLPISLNFVSFLKNFMVTEASLMQGLKNSLVTDQTTS